MCVDRDCGECSIVTQRNAQRARHANKGAQWVVLSAAVVLVAGHLAGVIESLVITVVCAGLLAIGFVVGWVWVMWRRLQGRPLFGPVQQVAAPFRQRQAVGQPQQPALPQTVNQSLALPANLSADETIRVLRDMRDGR